MGLYDESGNRISKANFPAQPVSDPLLEVTENVYERVPYPFEAPGAEGSMMRLAYQRGDTVRQSEIDLRYPPATVSSINPSSGPAAGGTVVTITGTNLDGVSSVTFGGVAGTNLQVESPSRLQVTTPAGTAGAVDVVVVDDSGSVTVTGGFTYQ